MHGHDKHSSVQRVLTSSRRTRGRSRRLGVLGAVALVLLAWSAVALAGSGRNSAATIRGSFADSCRDFAAHSTKDISHVELRYADGRVTKDESIETPDYSLDGAAGDELGFRRRQVRNNNGVVHLP